MSEYNCVKVSLYDRATGSYVGAGYVIVELVGKLGIMAVPDEVDKVDEKLPLDGLQTGI